MNKISQIKELKNRNGVKTSMLVLIIKYIYLRLMYNISIDSYFENRLFDKSIDHSAYYRSLHTYIHKWKYCKTFFKPNASKVWFFFHRIDYLFSKIIYPGLDAMDYFRYEFYKQPHKRKREFITEGFLKKMNNHFNPRDPSHLKFYELLDNKEAFNTYFKEFILRDWISSKCIEEQFVLFCENHPLIFIKESNGGGGSGIRKINTQLDKNYHGLYQTVHEGSYIIEEAINQSEVMSKLNPTSINTIRVYSVEKNGIINVVGATLRYGKTGSFIDNYSQGNYAACIDPLTGVVNSMAITQDGQRVDKVNGDFDIVGFSIPKWDEIVELVKVAHSKITGLRYIGWDVAIDSKERIQLIEGNTFAGVELQQHPSLIGKKPLYKRYW